MSLSPVFEKKRLPEHDEDDDDVQIALPNLMREMISLWCNHHHEKNGSKKSVSLPQNAELLHIY